MLLTGGLCTVAPFTICTIHIQRLRSSLVADEPPNIKYLKNHRLQRDQSGTSMQLQLETKIHIYQLLVFHLYFLNDILVE